MSRCSTPLPLPSANSCNCVRSPITSRRTATDLARLSESRRARSSCPDRYCAPMMARSRSSVPPITGTAIAIITTHSEVAMTMSIRAAPVASPGHVIPKDGRASVTGRLVGLGRHRHERLQFQKTLLADAFDIHQIFDPLESPALRSIFNDALRCLAANAGKGFELIERCGVQIDCGLGCRGRRAG